MALSRVPLPRAAWTHSQESICKQRRGHRDVSEVIDHGRFIWGSRITPTHPHTPLAFTSALPTPSSAFASHCICYLFTRSGALWPQGLCTSGSTRRMLRSVQLPPSPPAGRGPALPCQKVLPTKSLLKIVTVTSFSAFIFPPPPRHFILFESVLHLLVILCLVPK